MLKNKNTIFPVYKTFGEYLPKPNIHDARTTPGSGDGVIYYGYSHLGTRETEKGWRIERHTILGGLTKVEYGNCTMEFSNQWSERESIQYGR